jgi:hypothetical protein
MSATVPAHAAHLFTELMAAIVLIAGGAVFLGLADRRRRLGQPSAPVVLVPDEPAGAVTRGMLVGAAALAVAGAVIALAPRGPSLVGVVLAGLALVLLLALRFGVPRLDEAGLRGIWTALSIGLLPVVTLAVIAVVVVFATPSGAATIHH